ncbi:MAG: type II secretion system protein GspG [Candidatus Levybacteria bacterium]|nr:type II secretion system protein GspG [Candidatus Levybacteria bacterium]
MVVGTIGILAVAIFVILNPIDQMQKGRDTQRKSDLSEVQKVLEQYYRDNGQYPSHSDYKIVRLDGSTAEWGEQWMPYMDKLPKDPLESRQYVYYAGSAAESRQSYRLYASLERGKKDPQACAGICPGASSAGLDNVCGGDGCNYGVTSANISP